MKQRLFCFPWAGGHAAGYRPFKEQLSDVAEVWPVELPGHGQRLGESPLTTIPAMVEHLAGALRPYLVPPFAFWGHSMGAIMAFELTRRLRREGRKLPDRLFLSAHRAPYLPNPEATRHLLPDAELLQYVADLGGTSAEILSHPGMVELILPMLRADLQALNHYSYNPEPPLSLPITVLGGTNDRLARAELEGWERETTAPCRLQLFPGDHFYFQSNHLLLMELLRQELAAMEASCES